MINKIKFLFIPCPENNFRPRVLESDAFFILLVLVLGLKILSIASFSKYLGADIFNQIAQGDLYTLTNQVREKNHLPALQINQRLEVAAQLKLADMIGNGYFAHVSPQGTTPWVWFSKARYSYQSAGENLAMNFTASNQIMNAWMDSELHRKNILLPNFTEIGIAIGSGLINGQQTTIVVQEFGEPQVQIATVKPTESTPKKVLPATPVPLTTPATPATTFRSEASQPLARSVSSAPVKSQVRGAETINQTMLNIPQSTFGLIFVVVALASIMIFVLNIVVSYNIQFPALIIRSSVLVAICILIILMKNANLIGMVNHVIIP
jgi:hypothetical protein